MRAARVTTAALALLVTAAAAGGCGDEETDEPDKVDPPAKAPRGYRTVANRDAGFTLAAPRSWRARSRGEVTVLRSPGRLVAITLGADRGAAGRETSPAQYARSTLESLPGFEGSIEPDGEQVEGTPYSSALIAGRGTIETSRREQQIAVAALQVRGQVTFAATIFGVGNRAAVERILASVRAGKRGPG